MRALAVGPRVEVRGDRLYGRTPWIARLAWLGAYDRHVAVDRRQRRIDVRTRRFWVDTDLRRLPFERVDRLILRAQRLPAFGWWTYLSFGIWPVSEAAIYLIALGLRDPAEEFLLFTVCEGRSASGDDDGDAASSVLASLEDFLGVRVSAR